MQGGLEAERAERVKCKQEDMERDRRNFEAMQVTDVVQPLQCITGSLHHARLQQKLMYASCRG